jgi:hypothetical protein
VANQKYDNLTVMMTTGPFNWVGNPINAYLMTGATFDTTDILLSDTGGQVLLYVPVPGRAVGPTGALLGLPVSFNRVPKDEEFQVVLAKDEGATNSPHVIAFYDEDANGDPLLLQNNGTLIVRPELVEDPEAPPQLGVWVAL